MSQVNLGDSISINIASLFPAIVEPHILIFRRSLKVSQQVQQQRAAAAAAAQAQQQQYSALHMK